jgi:tripartite-type tricarboxylate transporter receptor subunit TctC
MRRLRFRYPKRGRAARFCAGLLKTTLIAAAFAAPIVQAADAAKSFPERPLRLVSPFAAGGNTDVIGRMIAPRLSERLGQNVIVENRPGAGGMIGASHVAKATPDGHTMLFISGAFTAHSAVTRNLPYDPVRDFAWISSVVGYPFVVVVNAESPVATVPELIAMAKQNPGKLNYGSVGTGSVFHLAAELFDSMAGTQMVHIPYKGSAEPLAQLMAGRLDVIFSTLTGVFPHIQAQRLRPLAVTSLEPSPQLPGVPTMSETLPGYEVTSFADIAAPRATPRPIVMRLNREIRAVLEQPEISKRLVSQGGEVQPSSPEEMTRRVARDIAKWQKIVAERGIEIQ